MKALLMAHMAFKKNLEYGLKDYGLNSGNPKIMLYIAEHEGCRQKEIAENCSIETATLSSVLSKMEDNGLIERKRLENDRRSYAIYPTKEGKSTFNAVCRQFDDTIDIALSGFSPKEADELRAYLTRVRENLNKANMKFRN